MTNILDQLHKDHINAARLLDVFETEINEFSNGNLKPDYLKWQNILLYMTTYQDIFHHPTEEIIFSYLKANDPNIGSAINELEAQHQELYQKSKALHDLISSVESSQIIIERDSLVDRSREYIHQLLDHMNIEESSIFPFVRKVLSENDWDVLEKETQQIDDPLFGGKRRAEYNELYESICEQ